jgi:hypothetical protein
MLQKLFVMASLILVFSLLAIQSARGYRGDETGEADESTSRGRAAKSSFRFLSCWWHTLAPEDGPQCAALWQRSSPGLQATREFCATLCLSLRRQCRSR